MTEYDIQKIDKQINYISNRLNLEDMHPANVFVENLTGKPICIESEKILIKNH